MRARGAAVVELGLVIPVLMVLVTFGLFLSEVVRSKLKLLEAARFGAWELTSHALDDFGAAQAPRHARAFEAARAEVEERADGAYADLDGVDRRRASGFIATISEVVVRLENQPVALVASRFETPAHLWGALGSTAASAHARLGLNGAGLVRARASARLTGRWVPKAVRLRGQVALIASDWHLADGADAQMALEPQHGGPQAGVHRGGSIHALWLQVNRMRNLGGAVPVELPLSLVPVGLVVPAPGNATYVVSHNYGLGPSATRGCDGDPGHPARDGLNNLRQASVLDWRRRSCFDTAPFRDQAAYDASLPVQQFLARGRWFMGCQQPQAEDPSEAGASHLWRGDKSTVLNACGGEVR